MTDIFGSDLSLGDHVIYIDRYGSGNLESGFITKLELNEIEIDNLFRAYYCDVYKVSGE